MRDRACHVSRVTCHGFTLVELLIAATMMSVLFIGLGGHLRGGIIVWRQTTQRVDALQREHVALDRLERDLANSYDDEDKLYGSLEEGKLPAPQFDPASLEWYTVSTTTARPSVRFVRYGCCESRDDTTWLWRTSQSLGEARSRSEPARELILPDCKELHLRYAYAPEPPNESAGLVWLEEWQSQNELPRLIEVTLQYVSGRKSRRVMAIPQGSFKSAQPSP
ncbi:MAG: type II secretion system protein GspJ [Candidatus Omnitrophota bacterium]|nr:type II secretion system protein GspJ [Candidatus Omnitrophota bacterium]